MYGCDQCNYQSIYLSSLTIHIKSKHEGVKYPCNLCDYQATLQCNLITHFKSKHEGVKYSKRCESSILVTIVITNFIETRPNGLMMR